MKVWILIWVFKGGVYAGGPHELERCMDYAQLAKDHDRRAVACVHKDKPTERRVPK